MVLRQYDYNKTDFLCIKIVKKIFYHKKIFENCGSICLFEMLTTLDIQLFFKIINNT